VNPNRLDEADDAASHGHLAAVGVAFLLGAGLIRTLRNRSYFADRPEPRLMELLDLVALGTVADVAQLKGLNRAFVAQGLKVMAARRNVGMSALVQASRLTRAPTGPAAGVSRHAGAPAHQREVDTISTPQRLLPTRYSGRFSALSDAPQPSGFWADEPATRCLNRLAECQCWNPLGVTGGDSKHTRAEQVEG